MHLYLMLKNCLLRRLFSEIKQYYVIVMCDKGLEKTRERGRVTLSDNLSSIDDTFYQHSAQAITFVFHHNLNACFTFKSTPIISVVGDVACVVVVVCCCR